MDDMHNQKATVDSDVCLTRSGRQSQSQSQLSGRITAEVPQAWQPLALQALSFRANLTHIGHKGILSAACHACAAVLLLLQSYFNCFVNVPEVYEGLRIQLPRCQDNCKLGNNKSVGDTAYDRLVLATANMREHWLSTL